MRYRRLATTLVLSTSLPGVLSAQPCTPIYSPGSLNANQQPARDIYKELVEINAGVTTGNITTAANAMAKRFRDAGIPEADIFRALGVPAFGVSGLFSDPMVDARAHGRDERMRIQSYYEGQEFLYRLTKALTSPRSAVP